MKKHAFLSRCLNLRVMENKFSFSIIKKTFSTMNNNNQSSIKSNTNDLRSKLFSELSKFKGTNIDFQKNSASRRIFDQSMLNLEATIDRRLKTDNFSKKADFLLGNFERLLADLNHLSVSNEKKFSLIYLLLSISEQINKRHEGSSLPVIVGIQGHQGSGKSTLTALINKFVTEIYQLNIEIMSIDDLYLGYNQLEDLKKNEPRFKFRGPPGTHDINLSIEILQKFKKRLVGYEIPEYDKSLYNGLGDRKSHGRTVTKPLDVLIFEGWFLGADPVTDEELKSFKSRDPMFLKEINNKYLPQYTSLWDMLDVFFILRPHKYEYSKVWRQEAETKMIKETGKGMTEEQISSFVEYFWDTVPPYLYFDNLEVKRKPYLTLQMNEKREISY